MRGLVFLLITGLMLGLGCAGAPGGPRFEPLIEPGPADTLVYVWRHDSLRGVERVDLRLDDEKLGRVKNGEFLAFLLDPGQHELRVRLRWLDLIPRSWNGLSFEAKPGQTLFLRIWAQYQETPHLSDPGSAPGRPESEAKVVIFVAPWPAEDAMAELQRTRRAPRR
jgi:hypothetical protein